MPPPESLNQEESPRVNERAGTKRRVCVCAQPQTHDPNRTTPTAKAKRNRNSADAKSAARTPFAPPLRPPQLTKANTERTVSAPSRWQATVSASPNRAALSPHRGRGPAHFWPCLHSWVPGPLPPPCLLLQTLSCHQHLGQARCPLARGRHWHAHRASPLCPRARDRPQAPSLESGRSQHPR